MLGPNAPKESHHKKIDKDFIELDKALGEDKH